MLFSPVDLIYPPFKFYQQFYQPRMNFWIKHTMSTYKYFCQAALLSVPPDVPMFRLFFSF